MKLTIDIPDETAELIKQHLADHHPKDDYNSHGPLTLTGLVEMLVEDAGLSIRRPGSWEGSNMHQVISSHGYPW